ncbi:Predicted transcriptional regulator YdeE, contains AraC-type DNA-binding domain [Paenibacillus sp. 1_12]|uniref:effector binding domain-containing protein n=1 Tax=Paenibacillus sp. 1_12 TaxID=1566278 RepID=UPI0008E5270A|nr:effector binding domain-containing protein [Paenibacillus sp. 1_12]SFL07075.1 Predicted transcriptional regulator YdeE, contains AraC-type DNA-binding domain [Paenibacillus sp. 1_12]
MLTVGQLARIFNVSAKTIRHYDAVGLFTPERVDDDNLYRYYASAQLPELRRILLLRSMGLGIEVIRQLKLNGTLNDAEKVKIILLEHAESIQDEITRQQKHLAAVQHMVEHISNTGGLIIEPKIEKKDSFIVVGMEWNSKSSDGGIPQMWDRFIRREHEVQCISLQPEVSYGICNPDLNGDFTYIAGFRTDGTFVPQGMIAFTLPSQHYAVFTHFGNLNRIGETMELIYSRWLPIHGLEPIQGIDFERYDERFLGIDNEKTQIDLYIPVKIL